MSLKHLSLFTLAFFILGSCTKATISQSVVTSTWVVVGIGSIDSSIHIYPIIQSPKSEIATAPMDNWYFLNIDGFTNISGLLSAWEICEQMSSSREKCQEKYKQSIKESTEKYSTLFQSNNTASNAGDNFCVNIGSRVDTIWNFISKTTVVGLAVGLQQGQNHTGALAGYPLSMSWRTEISDQFSPENEIVRFKDTNARYPQMKYIAATTPRPISDQLYFQSSGVISWRKISALVNVQTCTSRWTQNSVLIHLDDYKKLWGKLPLKMRYKNIGDTIVIHWKSETKTLVPRYNYWFDSIGVWVGDVSDVISTDWAGFYTIIFSSKILENADYIEILP